MDRAGLLIGINTLIASTTGAHHGIGFAVPVRTVINAVDQLRSAGRIERGFLGVHFEHIPQPLLEAMDIPHDSAQVTGAVPNTAADRAGLQAGDIITAIYGGNARGILHPAHDDQCTVYAAPATGFRSMLFAAARPWCLTSGWA